MEQLHLTSHLTKLQLFREVKKNVLGPMDRGKITPKRAGEILDVVKQKIMETTDPAKVKDLCIELSMTFPELANLERKVALEKEEQVDVLVRMVLEELMEHDNLPLASILFDEIAAVGDDQDTILARLQALCPIELKTALDKKNGIG